MDEIGETGLQLGLDPIILLQVHYLGRSMCIEVFEAKDVLPRVQREDGVNGYETFERCR